ncbi:hypothetical protein [Dictyobacter kobayashii]|uniref:Uncharacterized protein n=1 Tax=Dictyobacter kobayashii TaxID=2014872 RepID=A0A402ATJ4_9CHLR|nr:hypothetical protein [Dictyobacter kobayashii]GCE22389.1 hypothetical protein KDK_61890 [Dictyobacter kobayashii]
MSIFHLFHNDKQPAKEHKTEQHHLNLEADIREIRRSEGNLDIRKLHPEMTAQEAADYLQNLITNHMRHY